MHLYVQHRMSGLLGTLLCIKCQQHKASDLRGLECSFQRWCCVLCSLMHAPQRPEEAMEKYRYYVELPGDFWENSEFMEELKLNIAPARGRNGRIAYKDMLQVGQVHMELTVMDPGDA